MSVLKQRVEDFKLGKLALPCSDEVALIFQEVLDEWKKDNDRQAKLIDVMKKVQILAWEAQRARETENCALIEIKIKNAFKELGITP